MTREIKFRYRFRERKTGEIFFRIVAITDIENRSFAPNPFGEWEYEVLARDQFTGLRDKSGREIYEGDVVKSGNNDQIMTVKFYQSGFYLFWPDGGVSVPLWPFIVGNEIEVIGNVWEKGQADGD